MFPPRPTAAWLLLRSVVPYHSLFLLLLLRPSRQVRLLFLSTSLLSLGYPSPTPPSLFLAGYFDAQVSGFRYPSPAPPRLFLTGYFDAQVSLFRYPRAFFSLPVLVSLIVCFDALLFSHPTFPSRLLGCPARSCAALRFACDFYRSAVFTAPRFLSLCFRRFFGGSALLPPSCLLPPVFTHFRAARSLCRLAVRLRFLPLRGFYRSAFAGFLGALLFRRPPACCPQSSPSSGRTLWCRLVRSISGGPPS